MVMRMSRLSIDPEKQEESPGPEIVDSGMLARQACREERQRERKRLDRRLAGGVALMVLGFVALFLYVVWVLAPGSTLPAWWPSGWTM